MKNKKRLIILLVLLIIILVFYFISKINKSNNLTKSQNSTQQSQADEFDKVIVQGSGNEPGWLIKLNGHEPYQNTVVVSLLLDYGDSIWAGTLDITKQDSYQNNFKYSGVVHQLINSKVSSTSKNVIASFEKANCFDPKGDTHNYKVELNFNNEKTYQGCADILQ